MTKAELKTAKKWKAKSPDPGDLMVDVYDIDGKEVVDQKCFKSYAKCEKFIKSLSHDALARVYRFKGWERIREIGDWYKEID